MVGGGGGECTKVRKKLNKREKIKKFSSYLFL